MTSVRPPAPVRVIRSLALEGKHPLFYFPELNLLSFDGDADRRLSVPEGFGDVLFRYFLGYRRLTALRDAQQLPHGLFLEPWRKCNLACTYCYAQSGPGYSKKADARKVADLTKRYALKNVSVFGGEPLLDARYLLDLQQSHKWESFFFSTNALLLDDPAAQELLSQPNVSVQVSLEPAQWAYRVTMGGERQFDLMRRKLKLLAKKKPSLRLTIPPDAPHFPLKGFIDDLADAIGCEDFILSYWPARAPAPPPWLKDWIDESHALLRGDQARSYDDKLPGCHMASLFKEMSADKNGFRTRNCNAGIGAVAIGPDDTLHGCHELAVVEDPEDGVSSDHNPLVIDEAKRSALVHKWAGVMDPKVCAGCPARYICGGMCFLIPPPHSACSFTADMMGLALAEMICYHAGEVMELAARNEENIQKLIAAGDGLTKEVNSKKWNRLVSGELPLAEAVGLAGQLLSG